MEVTDVARLELVLDALARRKLVASAIQVGDIRISLGAAPAEEKPRTASHEELELIALRDRSKRLFGRVLPDQELRDMKGAM